jgi:hypothetical protein
MAYALNPSKRALQVSKLTIQVRLFAYVTRADSSRLLHQCALPVVPRQAPCHPVIAQRITSAIQAPYVRATRIGN